MPFVCDECGVLSIGYAALGAQDATQPSATLDTGDCDVLWYPAVALHKEYPDVPDHIAAAASEAHACQSIGAHRAAVMLARAVVEATAKHNGIKNGLLHAKIDEMFKQEIISKLTKSTAHEIRFMGNDMAHGDFVIELDAEDSGDVLTFMDELLAEVYQSPARLSARQVVRAARNDEAKKRAEVEAALEAAEQSA